MWTESKTSALERTKEFIPWTNIKEERAIFDAKIMASNELTKTEKEIFIKDLSKIPDSEFRKTYNYITKNYQEAIKWIQLSSSLNILINAFEEIEIGLVELKIRSWQLIRERQNELSQKDKLSAEASINNIIF